MSKQSLREHKDTYPLNDTVVDFQGQHLNNAPQPISKEFNYQDAHYLGRSDEATPLNIDFNSSKGRDALTLNADMIKFFNILLQERKFIIEIEQTQVVMGNEDIASFNMIGKNGLDSVDEVKNHVSQLMNKYSAIFDCQVEASDYRDKGRHHNMTINFLIKVNKLTEFLQDI